MDRGILGEKLAACLGEANASRVLEEALERSGREEVPIDVDDLLAFTKAHLIDDLVTAIGGRAVSGFLDELRDAARIRSGVRTSRPDESPIAVVAVLDRDVFRRASTARQLIARKMQIIALHKLDDLLTEAVRPDVIVLEPDDATSTALFRVLSLPGFDPAFVLLAADPAPGRRALLHAGVAVLETTNSTVPAEIAATVERALGRGR